MKMPTDDSLLTALVDQIHKVHPLVTDGDVARLKDLLNGKLSEGQLTEVELKKVAKSLLKGMATTSPKEEAK